MRRIRKMSRTGLVVAGFGVTALIASLTLTGSISASAATAHHGSLIPGALPHKASPGTVVTAGSTWTFYDLTNASSNEYCFVISPGASKIFTDDIGDAGKYKSSATSTTFTFVSGPNASLTFKFTWVPGTSYWDGNFTYEGTEYGPAALDQGNDPKDWGFC